MPRGRPAIYVVVDGKKQCSKCREWKALDRFSKNSASGRGLDTRCKGCVYQRKGRRKQVVIDGKKQCSLCKEWKDLHADFTPNKATSTGRDSRCKLCNLKRVQDRLNGSLELYLKRLAYGHRNDRRGLRSPWRKQLTANSCVTAEFLMELWREQGGRCAITGEPMTHIADKGRTPTNVSIDRIDNKLGYEPGNVQLVCKIVNLMKHEMSEEELLHWCSKILNGAALAV